MEGISSVLTTFGRKRIPIVAGNNCLFIGINQLRDAVGNPTGGTVTPGAGHGSMIAVLD